jgi:aminodeoxyfutalosine deaminase
MVHALKARYVFPISAEPIANGIVGIEGERIVSVSQISAADTVEDLGNVAILPGLVNAHTHLEFSNLKKPLGEPGIAFADWIRRIIEYRQKIDKKDINPVAKGLRECIHYGVTTIGEIAQSDWLDTLPQEHTTDGTAFLELIAPTVDRVDAAVELAEQYLSAKSVDSSTTWQIGLSPHAPYSVHPDLLHKIVALSVYRQIPLAMHLAESREEIQLLAEKEGPLKTLLNDLGAFDPDFILLGSKPLDYLQILAIAHRSLIIHGNYLNRDEIGLLADHAESMAVVFCPRTHEYFGHDRYPLEQMLTAGVTVCLGTDGRASTPNLDLLADIRHVARNYPKLDPQVVLQLGTLQGAKALGCDSDIGSLQPGKTANLAIVPMPEDNSDDPYELLFNSEESVAATWFKGKKIHV